MDSGNSRWMLTHSPMRPTSVATSQTSWTGASMLIDALTLATEASCHSGAPGRMAGLPLSDDYGGRRSGGPSDGEDGASAVWPASSAA